MDASPRLAGSPSVPVGGGVLAVNVPSAVASRCMGGHRKKSIPVTPNVCRVVLQGMLTGEWLFYAVVNSNAFYIRTLTRAKDVLGVKLQRGKMRGTVGSQGHPIGGFLHKRRHAVLGMSSVAPGGPGWPQGYPCRQRLICGFCGCVPPFTHAVAQPFEGLSL